jgi:hypothetical protein
LTDDLLGPDAEDASRSAVHPPRTLRDRWTEFTTNRQAAWRELRFAKEAGQRALACFRRLQANQPTLSGRPLYEAFACEYGRIDSAAARTMLHRAEASFAAWPNERELIFRDVVQYMVILEYLATHPKRSGTTANMTGVLSKIIPVQL